MSRWHVYGWCVFGVLAGVNLLCLTLRTAQAQAGPDTGRPVGPRARCVSVSSSVGKDGAVLVFRAFEDGTVEERRAESVRDGKVTYTWKPVLNPAN